MDLQYRDECKSVSLQLNAAIPRQLSTWTDPSGGPMRLKDGDRLVIKSIRVNTTARTRVVIYTDPEHHNGTVSPKYVVAAMNRGKHGVLTSDQEMPLPPSELPWIKADNSGPIDVVITARIVRVATRR